MISRHRRPHPTKVPIWSGKTTKCGCRRIATAAIHVACPFISMQARVVTTEVVGVISVLLELLEGEFRGDGAKGIDFSHVYYIDMIYL